MFPLPEGCGSRGIEEKARPKRVFSDSSKCTVWFLNCTRNIEYLFPKLVRLRLNQFTLGQSPQALAAIGW